MDYSAKTGQSTEAKRVKTAQKGSKQLKKGVRLQTVQFWLSCPQSILRPTGPRRQTPDVDNTRGTHKPTGWVADYSAKTGQSTKAKTAQKWVNAAQKRGQKEVRLQIVQFWLELPSIDPQTDRISTTDSGRGQYPRHTQTYRMGCGLLGQNWTVCAGKKGQSKRLKKGSKRLEKGFRLQIVQFWPSCLHSILRPTGRRGQTPDVDNTRGIHTLTGWVADYSAKTGQSAQARMAKTAQKGVKRGSDCPVLAELPEMYPETDGTYGDDRLQTRTTRPATHTN